MGQMSPLQAYYPKNTFLHGEKLIVISPLPNVPKALQINHIHMSQVAGWSVTERTRLPCAVQPVREEAHSFFLDKHLQTTPVRPS
jgi:hypothetical protein